ncbi:hypothetical protein VUR80DRAFT_10240 [Thermomyces stellatus]
MTSRLTFTSALRCGASRRLRDGYVKDLGRNIVLHALSISQPSEISQKQIYRAETKMKYLILLAAAPGALASLSCTEVPEGGLVMLACSADNTDKDFYWNYNGLYTPYSEDVVDCVLDADPFDDMKSTSVPTLIPTIPHLAYHPHSSSNTAPSDFVLEPTGGGSGPLDECNPNCVSESDLPADTHFGDKQVGINMAEDFPIPGAPDEGSWGKVSGARRVPRSLPPT